MTGTADERPVGADRVLAVMIELANHPAGVTLQELAHLLGASKPTVHRALGSLRRAGLAAQPSRGVYILGDELVGIANRFQSRRPEGARVEPALRALVRRYGETAHYAVRSGADVVYRAKVDPPEGAVRLTSVVGGRNPAHRTAVGKLLLSHAADSEEELRAIVGDGPLPGREPGTEIALAALWETLAETRDRGYAVDDQENELGINCLAVPVRWAQDAAPRAAISVSALAFRTPLHRLVDDVALIQATVDAATLDAGPGT